MAAAALHLDTVAGETFADELKPGTRLLLGQFTIDSFLCAGGFGITYLARDSLDRRMVVKECFPSTVCRRDGTSVHARSNSRQDEFRSIVALFMQEAMNLSQLDHPNIVKVHQVFEDNGTAYMAMDWIDGPDLLATIEGTAPRLRPDQIVHALHRMLDALEHVHALGFLHRDISPDNILLDRGTSEPVLIDFGAARKDVTRKSRVLSGLRVVKDGYSPQEFYISGSKQAPCSDLYALAASFFHLVADEAPKTSQERLSAIANGTGDPQRPLAGRVTSYDPAFLAAIDMAMSIFPRDRIQSAAEWRRLLQISGAPSRPSTARPDLAVPDLAGPDDVGPSGVVPNPFRPDGLDPVREAPLADLDPALEDRSAPASATPDTGGVVPERSALPPVPARRSAAPRLSIAAVVRGLIGFSRRKPAAKAVELVSHLSETLPVVTELCLDGGLVFEMQPTPTGVRTVVTRAPEGAADGDEARLAVGDVLLAYLPTGEILGTTEALAQILKRESQNRIATFGFAIQRNMTVIVGSFRAEVTDDLWISLAGNDRT